MFRELQQRNSKHKKDTEARKKIQSGMENTITTTKNTLEGIDTRLDEAEDWIGNLEDKGAENTQSEQHKEKN